MTESALKTHRAKIAALVKKARHKGDRKLLLYMAQKMAGTRSRQHSGKLRHRTREVDQKGFFPH